MNLTTIAVSIVGTGVGTRLDDGKFEVGTLLVGILEDGIELLGKFEVGTELVGALVLLLKVGTLEDGILDEGILELGAELVGALIVSLLNIGTVLFSILMVMAPL